MDVDMDMIRTYPPIDIEQKDYSQEVIQIIVQFKPSGPTHQPRYLRFQDVVGKEGVGLMDKIGNFLVVYKEESTQEDPQPDIDSQQAEGIVETIYIYIQYNKEKEIQRYRDRYRYRINT